MTAGDERQDEWRTGDAVVEAALVMDKLWGFGGWEVTQTHDSLRPYLLEETYELLDAIQSGDPVAIREELGDLLLPALSHPRIAEAAGEFTVDDVAATLVTKLAHRSPHLADDLAGPVDIAEQERAWEARKAAEKARESCIDGIALQQPALALAEKVVSRARKAGFPDELVPDELRMVRLGGPESAEDGLRKAALRFVARIRAAESAAHAAGVAWGGLDGDAWRTYWSS